MSEGKTTEELLRFYARRCAAAEARLARLVEALQQINGIEPMSGYAYSFGQVQEIARTVLRELEESDGE